MSEPSTRRRSADLDRLLTFVDAIVAIAVTLLVLPLADLAGSVGADDSVWQLLRSHGGELGAFLLSFAVIARLWLAQHRVVRDAVTPTPALTLALVAWTLTIVFLPFPTALLSATGQQAATKVLYLGTLLLSSVLLGVLAAAVARQRPGREARRLSTGAPAVIASVLIAVALALSVAAPALSYWPLLLLLLSGPLEHLYARRRPQAGRTLPGNA